MIAQKLEYKEAIEYVQNHPLSFKELPLNYRNDYAIAEIAVRSYGLTLKDASLELRGNSELAKIAISQKGCGGVIQHLNDEIKNNLSLSMLAISNWSSSECSIAPTIKIIDIRKIFPNYFFENKVFAMHCCNRNGAFIKQFPSFIKVSDVIEKAMQSNPFAYQYLEHEEKNKFNYAKLALSFKKNHLTKIIPDSLFANKKFILDTIPNIDTFVSRINESLKRDKDIATSSLKHTTRLPWVIQNLNIEHSILSLYIEENPQKIEHLPRDLALYFSTKEALSSIAYNSPLHVWLNYWTQTKQRKIISDVIVKESLLPQVEENVTTVKLTENQVLALVKEVGLEKKTTYSNNLAKTPTRLQCT